MEPIKLTDVSWSLIGSTDEYKGLKDDIDHVCEDTQGFIKEIRIADILEVFRRHGFEVMKVREEDNSTSKL